MAKVVQGRAQQTLGSSVHCCPSRVRGLRQLPVHVRAEIVHLTDQSERLPRSRCYPTHPTTSSSLEIGPQEVSPGAAVEMWLS